MAKRLFVITGQTASGKTKFALKLKKNENGVLINCDSRQIYKYLDIITGKDIKDILLYDIVDPKDYYSSFDYTQAAIPLIKKIIKDNKTPIIVGGAYLYIKHLLYNIETENIKPDWKLRKQLDKYLLKDLQNKLKEINIRLFNNLNQSDRNNPRRLIRKIEIAKYENTIKLNINKTFAFKIFFKNIKIEFIGLKFEKKQDLVKAIKKRVENRLKQGAIKEVKQLLKKGYSEKDPGLQTIGYKQIIKYLKGEISKQNAIEQWTLKEIQYAKRQYTFMKKDKNIKWRDI